MKKEILLLFIFYAPLLVFCQDEENKKTDLTETLSEEWSATRDAYKGMKYGISAEELVDLFGEPFMFQIIKGRHFYLYCKSDSLRDYLLPVLLKNDKVYRYDMMYKELDNDSTCTEHADQILETYKGIIGVEEFGEDMADDGRMTLALFESGSSVPNVVVDKYILQEIVKWINRNPDDLSIVGHTHNQGSKSKNLELSIQRAQAVIDLLEQHHGLKKGILMAEGEGEMDPLFNNDTEENRRRNSRVEVIAF